MDMDTIKIQVYGVKRIVPRPVIGAATRDMSWSHFLNHVCKLTVGHDDGILVCTTSYSAKINRGWMTSDLNDKVGVFIEKFKIRKDIYSVRIQNAVDGRRKILPLLDANTEISFCQRPPLLLPKTSTGTKLITTVGKESKQSEVGPPFLVPMVPDEFRGIPNKRPSLGLNKTDVMRHSNAVDSGHGSTPGSSFSTATSMTGSPASTIFLNDFKRPPPLLLQSATARHNLNRTWAGTSSKKTSYGQALAEAISKGEDLFQKHSISYKRPAIAPLNEDEKMESLMDSDSDNDNMSQFTAADVEDMEVRREGINIEIILPQVTRRVERTSNNFLLRVRNEISKLRKKGTWSRNYQRAPLTCYFLEEIFQTKET